MPAIFARGDSPGLLLRVVGIVTDLPLLQSVFEQ